MNFKMKLIDGTILAITEEEFKKLDGKTGLIFIPSLNQVINLSSVSRIASEDDFDKSSPKKDQIFGILHDGSRAVRQFGRWYDLDSPVNEQGNYTVSYDPSYYPEVAKDCVLSDEEWVKNYLPLPPEERKNKMLTSMGKTRLIATTGKMEKISEIKLTRFH